MLTLILFSLYQIEQITSNIGMVYSGMGPDYRLLIRRARKMAQDYFLMYHEQIPTAQLVYRVALVMQEYTQVQADASRNSTLKSL